MNKLLLFSIIILLVLSLGSIGCGQIEKIPEIDFEKTVQLAKAEFSEGPEINICIGSMITPEEGYTCYKQLLDYIGEKLDMKVNFIEKRTYAEVNNLLKNGDVDIAFVCGGPYVIGHDEFGLELIAAPVVNDEALYYSYIIVAKDSEINKFQDLRGATFGFADPLSNTGKLAPTFMLYELGETPQSFFREHLYTYGHDKSIKAVAQGVLDGAAVDSLIWDYMDKKNNSYTKKTKIIKISRAYGIPPVVARSGLDEETKNKLKKILLNMHDDETGVYILGCMLIDKFVEIDDSAYSTIRDVRAYIGE